MDPTITAATMKNGTPQNMDVPPRKPYIRAVSFLEVEVIEFPLVPGQNHPCQFLDRWDGSQRKDSAAVTMDWKAQSRTKMDLETYEERQRQRKRLRVGKKWKRMSRAVRKRISRNIGVETSDIESGDEDHPSKKGLKKKKKTKKQKKKKSKQEKEHSTKDSDGKSGRKRKQFRNPFGGDAPSSTSNPDAPVPSPSRPNDRFASCSSSRSFEIEVDESSDQAPQLPRRDTSLSPGLPRRTIRIVDPVNYPATTTTTASVEHESRCSPLDQDGRFENPFENHDNVTPSALSRIPHHPSGYQTRSPSSPMRTPIKSKRRSSLNHVANAIVVLAKQPVRLVKQPVRLAKYTTKKVRKRAGRSRSRSNANPKDSGDDADCFVEVTLDLKGDGRGKIPRPPVYQSGTASLEEDSHRSPSRMYSSIPGGATPAIPRRTYDSEEFQLYGREDCEADHGNSSRSRRSSLSHVTSAIGILAKQPGKLAKQPGRLAKYTTEKVRKGVGFRARNWRNDSDSEDKSIRKRISPKQEVDDIDSDEDDLNTSRQRSSAIPASTSPQGVSRLPQRPISSMLDESEEGGSLELIEDFDDSIDDDSSDDDSSDDDSIDDDDDVDDVGVIDLADNEELISKTAYRISMTGDLCSLDDCDLLDD